MDEKSCKQETTERPRRRRVTGDLHKKNLKSGRDRGRRKGQVQDRKIKGVSSSHRTFESSGQFSGTLPDSNKHI